MTRTPWLSSLTVAALLWGLTAHPAVAAQYQRSMTSKGGRSTAGKTTQPAAPTKRGSSNPGGNASGSGSGSSGSGTTGAASQGNSGAPPSTTNANQAQASGTTAARTTPTTPLVPVANLALVGRVKAPDATPLQGITVQARQGSRVVTTQTDRTGTYTLSLPAGRWEVSATDLDYDVTPMRKVYQVDTTAGTVTRIE